MRTLLLLLSFVIALGVGKGVCQSYLIEYTMNNFDYINSVGGCCSEIRFASADLKLTSGVIVGFPIAPSSEGSFVVGSKPTELQLRSFYEVMEFGTVTQLCDESEIHSLTSYGDCFQYEYYNNFGGCSLGDLFFTVKPVLPITASPPDDYCDNQSITLNNTSGFSNLQWQYRVGVAGTWENFSPGGNSVTFGIQDIFGASYTDYLNQQLFFRYAFGGSCDNTVTSDAVGGYTFTPSAVEVHTDPNSSAVEKPSCVGGSDAVVRITKISRDVLDGEVLTYELRTTGGMFIGSKSSSDQPNITPVEIRGSVPAEAPGGISAGNYQVLISSNLSLCGTPNPHIFPIITDPTPVTFTYNTPVQPSCYGWSNGSITINAAGGSGSNYTYSKDNGQSFTTSNVLSGLSVNALGYDVQVRDGKNCPSGVTKIPVGQPAEVNITGASITSNYFGSQIRCVGASDGVIRITATGGTVTNTGTLKFSKQTDVFVQGIVSGEHTFSGLGAGTYPIKVRDDNDCEKTFGDLTITPPNPIVATVTPFPTSCNNLDDGRIEVTNVSGGTGVYTVLRDGTTQFTGLPGGTYNVTIQDQNSCLLTVNNNIVIRPPAIGINTTPTVVTCSGGNDGSVEIAVTNVVGTPSFNLSGGTFQAPNKFIELAANTYSLLVEDDNNCTATSDVIIIANPVITGPITISTPISCNGGSNGALNLAPGGGVGPYTYVWSNGSTSEDISGLAVGDYTVTVKDTKNCEKSFNRTLTQPQPITINATPSDFNGSNVSCFGGNNGSINITPVGGNGGYTYSWSNGSISQNVNTLSAGTYSVTVTDNKSCTGDKSVAITQPAQLVTTTSQQDLACFGDNTGSITVSTVGGTTNYEYSINGGTNWQSATTFNNLTASAYTVLTRDANSCPDSDNVTLTSPANLVLNIDNTTNTTCNQSNGSASVSATGGQIAYSFNWYNSSNTSIGASNTISDLAAGIYRVVVTDQNNCSKQQNVTISSSDGPAITTTAVTAASCSDKKDGTATIDITQGQAPYSILWPDNQTTTTAINLAGGDYIVQVRDNTNCLALHTVTIQAPPELTIQTITQQNPNCNGSTDGRIEVEADGGNGAYTYRWNTNSTNKIITNLGAGQYKVTIKDGKNCQAEQQYTLTDPPMFTIDLGADQKVCEGQVVVKQSDVNNATYAWAGPNNFTSNQQQVSLTQPGTYTLTVINEKGCEAEDSFVLSFDTNLLKADFLMVSEAFTGDTIVVIDISWPMPESVNWQFDVAATVIDQSPDYSLIRFDEAGTYTTTLQAQLAQCLSTFSHSITIVENPNDDSGGRKSDGIINALFVYPNPAMEKLTVQIELNEEKPASVEFYHLQSNQRAIAQLLEGAAYYETELKVDHLKSGLYVLVVKAGGEVKSVKVIKL
jgi:hypothetical protein